MGDYPSRQAWASLELTDHIFAGALQEAALQDEVYCQILKQLTHNSKGSVRATPGTPRPAPSPPPQQAVPTVPSSPAPKGCARCSGGGGSSRWPGTQSSHGWAGTWSALQASWGGHSEGPQPRLMPQ